MMANVNGKLCGTDAIFLNKVPGHIEQLHFFDDMETIDFAGIYIDPAIGGIGVNNKVFFLNRLYYRMDNGEMGDKIVHHPAFPVVFDGIGFQGISKNRDSIKYYQKVK